VSDGIAANQPPRRCPQCQAPLEEGAQRCWLCTANSETAASVDHGSAATAKADEYDPWFINGAVWLAILVVVVVAMGVFNAQMPALGWMFGLTVFPALLFTLAGATLARMAGQPWEPLKKASVFMAAFVVSTLVGTVLAILLILAAIIALLQMCFESIGPR
jgi:hypothetical protein